ncbi:MAG: bacA [Candidatus Paceibacter sp.]|jgi:undecaprenyl-diphosphatase|nr:bacA [Candidatus Paceibacter sp.]
MNIISSIILGIVEGITEFLPISSTAHLEITSRLLNLEQSNFLNSFEIIIQFGAILAVVVIYFSLLKKNWQIWKKILAAFIPTGAIGFVLYKIIKNVLLGDNALQIIVWTLGIGGVLILAFEYLFPQDEAKPHPDTDYSELEQLPYTKAVLIGLAQSLAVVPGVSRSAATIIAGRSMGMTRKAIVEFSFLLAVPTMLAAAGYDLLKNAQGFSSHEFVILAVGFITAFIAAYFSVKWLLAFVTRHGFTIFGYYRIVLAILLAIFFL